MWKKKGKIELDRIGARLPPRRHAEDPRVRGDGRKAQWKQGGITRVSRVACAWACLSVHGPVRVSKKTSPLSSSSAAAAAAATATAENRADRPARNRVFLLPPFPSALPATKSSAGYPVKFPRRPVVRKRRGPSARATPAGPHHPATLRPPPPPPRTHHRERDKCVCYAGTQRCRGSLPNVYNSNVIAARTTTNSHQSGTRRYGRHRSPPDPKSMMSDFSRSLVPPPIRAITIIALIKNIYI